MAPNLRIFEDEFFTLDHADFCLVPGYLVLRIKEPALSLADLAPAPAALLGSMLSRATAAIEGVTGAERVYCLSFGEIDRRLHFHLFPRTRSLLVEYWQATGRGDEPVNGPVLFEWARTALASDSGRPGDIAAVVEACEALRTRLASRPKDAAGPSH